MTFFDAIREASDQIAALAVSSIAGAFVRAIGAPEKRIKWRVMQGIAGALSAFFLGGLLAHVFLAVIPGSGIYAYLGAGFIMGTGGEAAAKRIQEKFLGKED